MKKFLILFFLLYSTASFAGLEINPITGKLDKTGNSILVNGASTTTARIGFAQGISVTQSLDSGDAEVISVTSPLGGTVFAFRLQGYYTDGIMAEGELKTTNASISNLFAFQDSSIFAPTATATSAWSFGAAPVAYGTVNGTNLIGFSAAPSTRTVLGYSGTLTNMIGFKSESLVQVGTVTNLVGFYGTTPGIGGTVTNAYGAYFENVSGASNNYAIYTNSGLVRFGDNVSTTGTITSSRTSDLGWTVVSAANQACNTTCTSSCVFGHNLTAGVPGAMLACTDATSDECLCAGAS